MMPLAFGDQGKVYKIIKIGGKPEIRQHLADLGFTVGGNVEVISESAGNLIVNIRETRVAIGKELAAKIMI